MSMTFTVEDDGVIRALEAAEAGVKHLVELVAADLAKSAEREGGAIKAGLGEPWKVTAEGSTAEVAAPVWWAHFFAGGTKAHGPAQADHLVFSIDGNYVVTDFVRGIPATHFDEAAVDRTRSRLTQLIEEALKGE